MIKSIVVGASMVLVAFPAAAQTPAVNAARTAGAIGERFDGYLGFAARPSALLRSQVDTVNIRRRALYSNLASKRGASPQEVGITAGCQLLARVQVGQRYMLNDGVWRQRAAGQAAPRPGYCG